MSELLSVVIPSYNGAAFVAEAIRSVFRQTYRPIELVVVDDGSTDASREVIHEVCDGLAPLEVVVIEQENRGAHAAIMRGLGEARGELLSILNCDDAYHPERCARLLPHLDGASGLAFSGVAFIDERGAPLPASHAWPSWYAQALREVEHCPTTGYALLLHNFSVTSGNFVFTRGLYERLEGFSAHRFVHDWDFLVRSLYYAEPVFVAKPLLYYRIHEANTSETVRHRLLAEASDAIGRYVALCDAERPPNALAPCVANWPRLFPAFASRHVPFFAPDRSLATFFAPP